MGLIDHAKKLQERRAIWDEVDLTGEPLAEDLWALSQVPNERVAKKFERKVEALTEQAVVQNMGRARRVEIPPVRPGRALRAVEEIGTGRLVEVENNQHIIYCGATGCGKSNGFRCLLQAHAESGTSSVFHCLKDEGAALSLIWDDVLVVQPHQITENLFASPNPELRREYQYAVFQLACANYPVMPTTWIEALALIPSIAQKLGLSEDELSLKDLEQYFAAEGKSSRKKFASLAHALGALNHRLGKAAWIRQGIKPKARIKVDWVFGSESRMRQFLSALTLLRTQMEAMALGHTTDVRLACFFDEGGLSLKQSSYLSQISFIEQYFMEMRSYGVPLRLAAQSPDLPDMVKNNTGVFIFGRTPEVRNAREAQSLIGLSDGEVSQLQQLPPGEVFMRGPGFSGPVHGRWRRIDISRYPSVAEINERQASTFSALEREIVYAPVAQDCEERKARPHVSPAPTRVAEEPERSPDLTNDQVKFLRVIQREQTASVTELYNHENLGFSVGKAARIKKELVHRGLVVVERQPSTNGRPREVLRLTEAGRNELKETI